MCEQPDAKSRTIVWFLTILLGSILGSSLPVSAQVEFEIAGVLDPDLSFEKEAWGDFNEDGLPDLAGVKEIGPGTLMLSDGIGGYTTTSLPTSGAVDIVTGDFNQNGHLDLVLAEGSSVSIRIGDGTGQFGAPTLFAAGSDPLEFLEVADFNQDGDLDLVAANVDGLSIQEDEMIVLLGDGTGQFGVPALHSVGRTPVGLHVGRMNADSIPDVVIVHGFSQEIKVGIGDGLGGFTISTMMSQGSFELEVSAAGDLDNDGFLDLLAIAPNDGAGEARVHLADGLGGFDPHFFVPLGFRVRLDRPVLGDWDGDGNLDVAALPTQGFSHTVAVFYGAGDGTLESGPFYLGLPNRCNHVTAFDLDADGDDDLLATLKSSGPTTWLEPKEGRVFDTIQPIEINAFSALYTVADLNEDGNQDVVANASGTLFFAGDGSGGLNPAPPPFPYDGDPLFLEDFTGDGNRDVGFHDRFPNSEFRVYPGDGAGNYSSALVTSIVTTDASAPVVADFDRDGNLDFIVESAGASVTLYFGSGDGFFAEPTTISAGLQFDPRPGVAADLDGDDNPDLVVIRKQASNGPEDRVTVLLGDGLGGFDIVQHLSVVSDHLLVVDEDRDGHLDLVSGRVGQVEVMRGDGSGQFDPPSVISTLSSPQQLAAVDMTGDGLLDLVGRLGTEFSIAVNLGNGLYRSPQEFFFGGLQSKFGVGDLDGDGLNDMVTGAEDLWILLNRTQFYRCRDGNVNAGAGSTTDVLFVNGSAGARRGREVTLFRDDPFELRIDAAPSGGSRFAVYVWPARLLSPFSLREFGFGVGSTCMPMPIDSPPPRLSPAAIWKTIPGFSSVLGEATHPSSEAPSTLISVGAIGIPGDFLFQGVILDPDSIHGQLAVTNGVLVSVQDGNRP